MNFDDLLIKTLQMIRDSHVPPSRQIIIDSMNDNELDEEILINVFEYIEDEHLADYLLRGYVISPSGRDYLRQSKTISTKQARLDFSGGF